MTTNRHPPGPKMNEDGQPMGSSPRQLFPEVAGPVRPGTHRVRQPGRRRRPSGEAPPLPHHLQTSGIGWLVALVVLVTLSIAVFAGGMRGPAVTVTVLDDAMVRWLARLDTPGLAGTWQALASLSSWWVLNASALGLVLALLVLRRFRHLVITLIVNQLLTTISQDVVASKTHRPRPFEVDIEAGWGGWAISRVLPRSGWSASSSGRTRCWAGIAVWSSAPGPTRIVDQGAPHSTRTCNR